MKTPFIFLNHMPDNTLLRCMQNLCLKSLMGQGLFEFRFQLVYTSLDEVLPKVQELWDVAQQIISKESHQRGKQRLAAIIQVQEEHQST